MSTTSTTSHLVLFTWLTEKFGLFTVDWKVWIRNSHAHCILFAPEICVNCFWLLSWNSLKWCVLIPFVRTLLQIILNVEHMPTIPVSEFTPKSGNNWGPCIYWLPAWAQHQQHHRSRGLGWRIHGSVEDTKLSTNKQHSLSLVLFTWLTEKFGSGIRTPT